MCVLNVVCAQCDMCAQCDVCAQCDGVCAQCEVCVLNVTCMVFVINVFIVITYRIQQRKEI